MVLLLLPLGVREEMTLPPVDSFLHCASGVTILYAGHVHRVQAVPAVFRCCCGGGGGGGGEHRGCFPLLEGLGVR